MRRISAPGGSTLSDSSFPPPRLSLPAQSRSALSRESETPASLFFSKPLGQTSKARWERDEDIDKEGHHAAKVTGPCLIVLCYKCRLRRVAISVQCPADRVTSAWTGFISFAICHLRSSLTGTWLSHQRCREVEGQTWNVHLHALICMQDEAVHLHGHGTNSRRHTGKQQVKETSYVQESARNRCFAEMAVLQWTWLAR